MGATVADLLMPQVPMEKTHKRMGIENPLLKMLADPLMLGSMAAGGVGMGAAVGGRRAARKAGESIPEFLAKTVKRGRARAAGQASGAPQRRSSFLRGALGADDFRPSESIDHEELLRRIFANRQVARTGHGIDPDIAHSFDFGSPRSIEAVQQLGDMSRKIWKAFPNEFEQSAPFDVAIDAPARGFMRKTQRTPAGPMRYVMSRDTPIWDFDMPNPAHQSQEQVRAYHLGDVLESLRASGAGAGTLYRTPGGARYIDKATAATPHDMAKAGGVPSRVDPFYEGLISQPHRYKSFAPTWFENEISNFQRKGTPTRQELSEMIQQWRPRIKDVERGLDYETLLNPSFAARLSPKHGRKGDYVAQPILDIGQSPVVSRTPELVQRLHDQPTSLAMQNPVRREAFFEDVAGDLPMLDKPDREAIVQYIMKRYGVPLSVATMLAGTGAARPSGEGPMA